MDVLNLANWCALIKVMCGGSALPFINVAEFTKADFSCQGCFPISFFSSSKAVCSFSDPCRVINILWQISYLIAFLISCYKASFQPGNLFPLRGKAWFLIQPPHSTVRRSWLESNGKSSRPRARSKHFQATACSSRSLGSPSRMTTAPISSSILHDKLWWDGDIRLI